MRNETSVNWVEELKGEVGDCGFHYVFPLEAESVRNITLACVYQTLAGEEVSTRSEREFLDTHPEIIASEPLEIAARGVFASARFKYGEKVGYENEWTEAKKQAEIAVARYTLRDGYSEAYDYWNHRYVHGKIAIELLQDDPNFVKLWCSLSEFADQIGLPSVILERKSKWKARDSVSPTTLPAELLAMIVEENGIDPQSALQQMVNRGAGSLFVEALNEAGHFEKDEVRNMICDPSKSKPFTPQDWFEVLSEIEKTLVQKPHIMNLQASLNRRFTEGKSAAGLSISLHTNSSIRFNPQTGFMEGDVLNSEFQALYATLSPKLRGPINHQEFLNIRRQAQEYLDGAGFLRKTN